MSSIAIAEKHLPTIIVMLRALTLAYHHAHIEARGPSFYSDHLLLQRLYDGTGGGFDPVAEVDSVMERLKGLSPSTVMEPAKVAAGMQRALENLSLASPQVWRHLHTMELHLTERLSVAITDFERDNSAGKEGVINLLQGIADAHQTNQYLIQQRLTA